MTNNNRPFNLKSFYENITRKSSPISKKYMEKEKVNSNRNSTPIKTIDDLENPVKLST